MNLQKSALFTLLLMAVIPGGNLQAQDNGNQDFKVELNINGCQFSGGSDGYGNVEVQARSGGKKIQVEVLYGDDYTIEPVNFSGTGSDQMSTAGGGNSNKVNIFNRNDAPADVYYGINLKHKQTGEMIRCDPRIVNL